MDVLEVEDASFLDPEDEDVEIVLVLSRLVAGVVVVLTEVDVLVTVEARGGSFVLAVRVVLR